MSDYERRIGEVSEEYVEQLDEARVRAFSRAIGAADDGTVPPTYVTRFRQGEFELMRRLGITLEKVLHSEQEYRWVAPLRIGMALRSQTRLADVMIKRGARGELVFLKLESTLVDEQSGRAVVQTRTGVVVRELRPEAPQ